MHPVWRRLFRSLPETTAVRHRLVVAWLEVPRKRGGCFLPDLSALSAGTANAPSVAAAVPVVARNDRRETSSCGGMARSPSQKRWLFFARSERVERGHCKCTQCGGGCSGRCQKRPP